MRRTESHTVGTRCHSSIRSGLGKFANAASASVATIAATAGLSNRSVAAANLVAVLVLPTPRIPSISSAG